MGVVYEARQISLNRKVALKVLSANLGLTPKAVQRFHREAEAAAKLHHTNIVPVYATGEEHETHFYAMELIEGPSLDRVIRQLRSSETGQPLGKGISTKSRLSPARMVATGSYVEGKIPVEQIGEHPAETEGGGQSAPLGVGSPSLNSDCHYFDTVAKMSAEVADALEHAHKNGIIHRDIKPSNLLLSPDGRLSINDFGLARILEQPGLTLTGEFVGSPLYMSPEQITAGRTPLDHRTDIYSLGATLYELLTLQPPFTGERRDAILAQIIHKEPKAPGKLNKKVPRDLETICLKALDKDPDQRYQTAGAMADDLRRCLNRFAILARQVGPIGRLVKWIRRRPSLAAALACAVTAVLVAAFTMYQAHVAEQRHLATLRQAEEQHVAARRQQAIERAMLEAMSGNFDAAEGALQEAVLAGASTGQARMIDGLLAQQRGDFAKACLRLEQAVQLMPDSVAARAMLVVALQSAAQHEKSDEQLRALEGLSPTTPEDYLFKARAEMEEDWDLALRTLNDAIRLYNRPLARLIRAQVRANQVSDTAKVADAEEALKDARAATDLLPNNVLALLTSVHAHLAAAGVYDEAGDRTKRDQCLSQAGKDVQAACEPSIRPHGPLSLF
jgi:serine/threonine protein kinase